METTLWGRSRSKESRAGHGEPGALVRDAAVEGDSWPVPGAPWRRA